MAKKSTFVEHALHSPRMVSARNLSVGYEHGKAVFTNLYLDFIEGQTSVILGPGNSGKSTFLKVLATPQGQSFLWQTGNLYVPWPTNDYSPQHFEPLHANDETNLESLMKQVNPRIKNPIRQIHLLWGKSPHIKQKLCAHMQTPFNQLGAHLKKLISLTLILMKKESLVLLDEPEVGCSLQELQELINTLNLFRQQRTVIVVTHHLVLAREVSDFSVLMAYGRVIESKPTPIFFSSPEHPYTQSVIRMGC